MGYFATRDWEAVGQVLADDFVTHDRRRAVNAGIRHGRDAEIENWQAAADVGFTNLTPTVVAIRGERLALARLEASGRDPEAIQGEFLVVIEIDADERVVAFVVFDPDHFDAALAELDVRYLAGEAAAHAGTWSVIAGAFVAHNRRQVAATTPDVVSIDHRRVAAFAPGEGIEYLRAGWDLDQSLNIYIEAPHRVNNLGAVFTWAGHGTSHEGFDAEWRGVNLITVDGEIVSRSEVFDEEDLDAALAKFEELSRPAPRLENAASQAGERFLAHYAAGDWDALAEILADDFSSDDRRGVVGAGIRHGRDAEILNMRAIAGLWKTNVMSTVMATRGGRLVLMRARFSGRDQGPEAFVLEVLGIVEINTDERIVAFGLFDPDDIDAAIAELDAKYLAGEAAPYRDAWSSSLPATPRSTGTRSRRRHRTT